MSSLGTWGLRLLALVLAVLSWVFVTLENIEPDSQRAIDTTIRYDSPDGFILLDPPDDVRVTVRGPASELRGLNPLQVDVSVSNIKAEKGTQSIQLQASNVFLPGDLEIVSIEPASFNLVLDRQVRRMLPITPRLTGEPAAGAIAQEPVVQPSTALVRGPESRINEMASLTTTPISLTGHALDFSEDAGVISEDPTIQVLDPRPVRVTIRMLIPEAGEGSSGR